MALITADIEAAARVRAVGAVRHPTMTMRMCAGCYFWEGPQRPSDNPKRLKTVSTQNVAGPELGGIIADLKTYSILGVKLHASVGVSKTMASQYNQRPADEILVDDREACARMAGDATAFESYKQTHPDDRVKGTDGKLLPVVGYGWLCILLDQEDGTF